MRFKLGSDGGGLNMLMIDMLIPGGDNSFQKGLIQKYFLGVWSLLVDIHGYLKKLMGGGVKQILGRGKKSQAQTYFSDRIRINKSLKTGCVQVVLYIFEQCVYTSWTNCITLKICVMCV